MSIKVRFAPSPTGLLHVGNIRMALINWLLARQRDGSFLLRLDDTDAERSTEAFAEAIKADLAWLGLSWDRFVRQSDRLETYEAAADHLKQAGRLYPCYETADELSLKRKALLAQGRPPIYDRAALKLDADKRAALEAEGRRPHWRFRIEHRVIEWDDLAHGKLHFEGRDLSDPVLIREDGRPLFTLSSTVDDIELGITHIVRGDDHIANSAIQIQLFEALGDAPPALAHLPLMLDAGGEKLSKRAGSLSVEALRDQGYEPMAILSLLARLGSADPVEPFTEPRDLVEQFDLSRFSAASPRFDEGELARLNARLLHAMPFERVRDRLGELALEEVDETTFEAIRPNLSFLKDVGEWWQVTHGPVTPVIEDAAFAAQAASLLPKGGLTRQSWGQWTAALKEKSGRTGKALFLPLRLALTGRSSGPEMAELLPLIGRERALKRLGGEQA